MGLPLTLRLPSAACRLRGAKRPPGIFLSPDTIVPEPTLTVDYNRYLYARADPLNLVDPSGHCVVAADGSPDRDADPDCWNRLEDAWAAIMMGLHPHSDPEHPFEMPLEEFLIAHAHMTFEHAHSFACSMMCPFYSRIQIWDNRYNPPPTWNEPPEQSVFDLAEYCSNRDCVAVGIDVVGVVATGLTVVAVPLCGATAPACATVGTGIGLGSSIVGLIRTTTRPSTKADRVITGLTVSVGVSVNSPKAGLAASIFQLLWDTIVSPSLSSRP